MPVGISNAASTASLSRTGQTLQTQLQQISSGQRITRAAIDPAGLGVFVELDTAGASNRVAMRNANDGLSMLQTAEGATSSITDSLQRMRELAVQSSSGTLNDAQRGDIDNEFQQLRQEIDRVSGSTRFNGRNLADGSSADVDVQVGTDNDAGSRVGMGLTDLSAAGLGVDTLSLSTQGGSQSALDALDAALDTVSSERAGLGASSARMESALRYGEARGEALAESAGRIMDVDYAKLLSEQTGSALMQQAGISAQVQSRNIQRTAILGLL